MASSYLAGTASIRHPIIETPPRTTSLRFRQIIMDSPPSSLLSMFEDEFEEVDLDSTSTPASCSWLSTASSSSYSSSDDLTLESMSHVIAAAIELSMSNNKRMSSFSAGNASIKYNKKSSKKKENRLSKNPFKWRSTTTSTAAAAAVAAATTTKPMQVYDDGKQELIYRGIPVKEVKTTLDPMIVSMQCSNAIPEITLQRPEFARINY